MDEDAVFRAPPKEFTAARDALAAALKAAGRGGEAKAVKAWKRPPLTVWLWNRLFLDGQDAAKEIAQVAEVLGHAIEGGEGAEVSAAIADLRAAGVELVARARELAEAVGIGFTTAQERELTELVQGLPWSRSAREQAARGRLLEPPPPVDPLEAMRLVAGAAPLSKQPEPPQVTPEEKARLAALAALAEADAALEKAQVARDQAEKARDQAQAGVARAEKVLADAEARLEEAAREEAARAQAVARLKV